MTRSCRLSLIMMCLWGPTVTVAHGQTPAPPEVRAGRLSPTHAIDGRLDDADWAASVAIDAFSQTEPNEGAPASGRTTVRVLAGPKALVIGIDCTQPADASNVSFSVRRDAPLNQEDHVKIVLGPSLDGRSGYVFAVNPSGARYDAIINPGGENENADWDGVWDAATVRRADGWSAEIWIPFLTLTFKPGVPAWHFNVQRRVQALLETDRWASAARQYQVTQTSRAGLLTNLPAIDLGRGLSVRPAAAAGVGVPAPGARVQGDLKPSLDVSKRLGTNVVASATVNTDFAETEVDTRRTNLTRFPLFFPEKRTFFLEGSDIFAFGLGLNQDVLPYFSRRIGLVAGAEVPIIAGAKVNGRAGGTNFGGLVVGTNDVPGVVNDPSLMGVFRVKQNLWQESSVGAIATVGDPLGQSGRWLAGGDFTYATSRFRGNRNILAGAWVLATDQHAGSDATAAGVTIDYPNDEWDGAFTYKRIGRDFAPAVGFVPRPAAQLFNLNLENRTRLARGPLQQLSHEFRPFMATDLTGQWVSYRVFTAPINWRFRSGDRLEFNVNPTGERLELPFEVATGVVIPAGRYHWRQYRLEAGTAQKRRFYTQLTWWFGGFYDGTLGQMIGTGAWNPTALFTVEFSGEHNRGRLKVGSFDQTLVSTRLRVNVSSDFSVASYVQYDTVSKSLGVNTRLRWSLTPVADLFVVYNHNVQSLLDRWQLQSNQLVAKLQYAWRR
ncbi:MAG: DUF5916 domain-containing protein [Acidobacteriota bacterium]